MADFLCLSEDGITHTKTVRSLSVGAPHRKDLHKNARSRQRSSTASKCRPIRSQKSLPPQLPPRCDDVVQVHDSSDHYLFFPSAPTSGRLLRSGTSISESRSTCLGTSLETVHSKSSNLEECTDKGGALTSDSEEHMTEINIICPICDEVMYKPVRTRCDHAFCFACISMWLKEAPLSNCPLCRSSLSKASENGISCDHRAPFTHDRDLEAKAIARLGNSVYHERELDTLEDKLAGKLAAYRHKLDHISEARGVAAFGLGAAGVSTSFVGVVAGVGVAAFLGGMKLAAWLDDQGRYCLLRSPHKPSFDKNESEKSCIYILNLLGHSVSARIFVAKRRKTLNRRSVAQSIAEFVAMESRTRSEEPRRKLYLEASGEPLVKSLVGAKSEVKMILPPKKECQQELMLTAIIEGLVVESEVASCKIRPGQRFILCEFDESAREVLRSGASTGSELRSTPSEETRQGSSSFLVERSSSEIPPLCQQIQDKRRETQAFIAPRRSSQ